MGVLFVGLVPSLVLPPTVTTPRRHPLITLSATSTELAALAAIETKTAEDREKILGLSKQLEAPAATSPRYLDAPNLVGNYELLYFDKSVDGGRDGKTKPKSIRRRMLGLLFQNRGSFQHVVDPGRLINFLSFRFLGITGKVVAEGTLSRLDPSEISAIAANATTLAALSSETVRVVFSPPRVTYAGLCFEITGAAAQPPVVLCTTYVDEVLRLGVVSGGGRFVFGRGGKADEPLADEWKGVLERQPTDGRLVGGGLAAVAVTGVLRPMLLAQVVYAAGGVGIGFGGTKVFKFLQSAEGKETVGEVIGATLRFLNPRARLRAALLRLDPSLAESEGETIGWKDLRGPLGKGKKKKGGPPKPPWKRA